MTAPIVCRVGGAIVVESPPPAFREAIRAALTRTIERRGPHGARHLDAVCLVRDEGCDLVVPRGAVEVVRDAAASAARDLRWLSAVVTEPVAPCDLDALPLRDYQRDAVQNAIRRVQTLIDLPCGGGKTTIGAAVIASLGVRSLVVVPTRDLVEQWVARLRAFGILRVSVATERSGPLAPGEVVVGIPGGVAAEVLASVACLVVDECHRGPARTWAALVESCAARWRVGLTATPERADGLGWALPYVFGSWFVPATTCDLVAAGYLRRPTIVPVGTGWSPPDDLRERAVRCPACLAVGWATPRALADGTARCAAGRRCRARLRPTDADLDGPYGALAYSSAVAALAADPHRREQVADLVAAAHAVGRCVLALVPTVASVAATVDALAQRGVDARPLTGRETPTARQKTIDAVRRLDVRAVVATRVADEGLDLPALDCLVLGEPGRSRGRALQRVGRVVRPGGAPPLVLDLVDDAPEFASQARSRRQGFAAAYGSRCLWSDEPLALDEVVALIARRLV